jgi:hypothetical protein
MPRSKASALLWKPNGRIQPIQLEGRTRPASDLRPDLTWVVANPRNGKRSSRLFAINEAERRVLATSWKGAPESIEHGIETAPVTLC